MPADVADRVLTGSLEVGLIDDAAYARHGCDHAIAGGDWPGEPCPASSGRVGWTTRSPAKPSTPIGPDDEVAAARALVVRRLPSTAGAAPRDPDAAACRVARPARDTPGSLSLQVVREVLAETSDDTGGDIEAARTGQSR